ncbi:hypothetical protein [Pseudomonas sp. PS01301]|uniref:hypothetical protein n=1 Tax=Pseudomonas sp. PS01301 TaxID=2991437 RepID=UPI002499AF76|nr:hypothetical protein [Pseudomonas sp. PS01301]
MSLFSVPLGDVEACISPRRTAPVVPLDDDGKRFALFMVYGEGLYRNCVTIGTAWMKGRGTEADERYAAVCMAGQCNDTKTLLDALDGSPLSRHTPIFVNKRGRGAILYQGLRKRGWCRVYCVSDAVECLEQGNSRRCSNLRAQCHADMRNAIIEGRVSFSGQLAELLPVQGVRARYTFDERGRYVSPERSRLARLVGTGDTTAWDTAAMAFLDSAYDLSYPTGNAA